MDKIDEILKMINNGLFEVVLFPDTTVKKFKTFSSIKEFVDSELVYWKNYTKGNLKSVYEQLTNVNNHLNTAFTSQNNENINVPKNSLTNAINILKSNTIIYSQTSTAKFITELYNKNYIQAEAAYNFISQNAVGNRFNEYHYFIGLMSAFIIKYTDDILNNKISSEETSLSEISKEYITTTDNLKIYYKDTLNDLTTTSTEFKDGLNDWRSKFEENLLKVLNQNKKSFEDLKNYYEEKLRIEGPARYWEDLHKEYLIKGRWWIVGSVIISLFFVCLLFYILYDFSQVINLCFW